MADGRMLEEVVLRMANGESLAAGWALWVGRTCLRLRVDGRATPGFSCTLGPPTLCSSSWLLPLPSLGKSRPRHISPPPLVTFGIGGFSSPRTPVPFQGVLEDILAFSKVILGLSEFIKLTTQGVSHNAGILVIFHVINKDSFV